MPKMFHIKKQNLVNIIFSFQIIKFKNTFKMLNKKIVISKKNEKRKFKKKPGRLKLQLVDRLPIKNLLKKKIKKFNKF